MSYSPADYSGFPPAAPRTNGMAIASLVCGILGFSCCWPVSAAGLWLGIAGRRSIANSQGAETGDGLALAGIVLSAISLVLGLAFFALWIWIRFFDQGSGSYYAL